MFEVIGPLNTGVCAGGAGVSTANATSTWTVTGLLMGVYVRYNDSPPAATTDLTIQTPAGTLPIRTLLTITNGATSGYYPILKQAVDETGANTGQYVGIPLVGDTIKVTIAQANDADSADIWLYVAS